MRSSASAEPPASKKKLLIVVFVVTGVLLVMLSACIGIWKLYYADSGSGEDDIAYQLPDYVYSLTAPTDAERAYLGAIDHSEELSRIPCYCGCGQSAGHESVRDCFIASSDDGNIVFDRHGAT